jgi:hypothetical protein
MTTFADIAPTIAKLLRLLASDKPLDREGNSLGIFATMKEAADAFGAGST